MFYEYGTSCLWVFLSAHIIKIIFPSKLNIYKISCELFYHCEKNFPRTTSQSFCHTRILMETFFLIEVNLFDEILSPDFEHHVHFTWKYDFDSVLLPMMKHSISHNHIIESVTWKKISDLYEVLGYRWDRLCLWIMIINVVSLPILWEIL